MDQFGFHEERFSEQMSFESIFGGREWLTDWTLLRKDRGLGTIA